MRCPECFAEIEPTVEGFCPNCGKLIAEGTMPKISEGFKLDKKQQPTSFGGNTVIVIICIVIITIFLAVPASQCSQESTQVQSTSDTEIKEQERLSEFILSESNTRYYSEEELKDLSNWDLCIARNEVYARLGRGFKSDDLVDYVRHRHPAGTFEEDDGGHALLVEGVLQMRQCQSFVLFHQQIHGTGYGYVN